VDSTIVIDNKKSKITNLPLPDPMMLSETPKIED
jgi:hypothetical protein